MGGAELAATRAGRTANLEAHDLYLQGRAAANQLTEPALRRALDYYARALAKDSSYALAYVGIAWVYYWLADVYIAPRAAWDSVKSAALARDSLLPEGHALLGNAISVADWDFKTGTREYQRALALDPNAADVRVAWGLYSCILFGIEEALEEVDRAIALDRLSPLPSYVRENCLYVGRRYDRAIAQHAQTAALDPNFFYLDSYAGASYREQGRLSEALAEYRRVQAFVPDQPLYGLAVTYARMGNIEEARRILERLTRPTPGR